MYTPQEERKSKLFPLLSHQFFRSSYSIIISEQTAEKSTGNHPWKHWLLSSGTFFSTEIYLAINWSFYRHLGFCSVFSSLLSLKQWIYSLIFQAQFPCPPWCWECTFWKIHLWSNHINWKDSLTLKIIPSIIFSPDTSSFNHFVNKIPHGKTDGEASPGAGVAQAHFNMWQWGWEVLSVCLSVVCECDFCGSFLGVTLQSGSRSTLPPQLCASRLPRCFCMKLLLSQTCRFRHFKKCKYFIILCQFW